MSGLKLSRRDDPLAAAPKPVVAAETAAPAPVAPAPAEPREDAGTAREPKREKRTGAARGGTKTTARGEGGPYDGDRVEQTGWRFYETVKAGVRDAAEELSATGVPTSEVALAQALCALRMPETLEERAELMREWNTRTASRRRRSA